MYNVTDFKQSKKTELVNTKNVGDKIDSLMAFNKNYELIDVCQDSSEYKVLSIFPSIDTGPCEIQTLNMFRILKDKKNVSIFNVSSDLPFALSRWCIAKELPELTMLSATNGTVFGDKLGLQVKKYNILFRALFVLNNNNEIVYKQIQNEIADQLNFDEITNFLKAI